MMVVAVIKRFVKKRSSERYYVDDDVVVYDERAQSEVGRGKFGGGMNEIKWLNNLNVVYGPPPLPLAFKVPSDNNNNKRQ